jgi:hypothetical protein
MLFVVIFVVAESLAAVSTGLLRRNDVLTVMSVASSGFMALALTSINLSAGAYFSVYSEKNPIRIASSQGATLTFLVSLLYLAMVAFMLFIPLYRYFEVLILKGISSPGWLTVAVSGIGVISVCLFFMSSLLGVRTIARDY